MQLPIYQITAFADGPYTGNPASIVLVEDWLPDATMFAIARENNQTTTAFLRRTGDAFALRWFTPAVEEEICGHATLATAHLVFETLAPALHSVTFSTKSGPLAVARLADGRLEIDFPAKPPGPVTPHPDLLPALSHRPHEILAARDYLLIYDRADDVRALRLDIARLRKIDRPAVIATAPGDGGYDCVSRFFAPGHGIDEDPATGAAHACLVPYWAKRLDKNTIRAHQASKRGGYFECTMRGGRIGFVGRCHSYMQGTIQV